MCVWPAPSDERELRGGFAERCGGEHMLGRRLLIASLLMGAWMGGDPDATVAGGPVVGEAGAGGAGSAGQLPRSGPPAAPLPESGGPPRRGPDPRAVASDGLLQVDRIEVEVIGHSPALVQVRVQGMLLDGCTSLGPVSQRRRGGAVTVTIPTVSTGGPVCTQLAQLVDTIVRLEGRFAPGDYRVRVNGIERAFRVG
jgi:hypothetical protein